MKSPNEEPLGLDPSGFMPEIPRDRLFHEGLEPFAFEGIHLRIASVPAGFQANLDYILGPAFKAALRDRLRKQDRCLVNGGILSFKEPLPWEWVDALAGTRTLRLRDVLRLPTFTPARALHALLLDRLTRLTIRIAADDAASLEFRLTFDDGRTLQQRVARTDWSDIFPLPPRLGHPTSAP